MDITGDQALLWLELTRLEPRLQELLEEARAIKDDGTTPSFCANRIWYGTRAREDRGFKGRLELLVGWNASKGSPDVLTSHTAYDAAYRIIYSALPDCRNCLCV